MICRNVQILTKNVRLISRSISARGFKKIQALDPPVKQLLERLTKVKISTNRHSHVPAYTHAFIHALIRTYINSHIPKKKKNEYPALTNGSSIAMPFIVLTQICLYDIPNFFFYIYIRSINTHTHMSSRNIIIC